MNKKVTTGIPVKAPYEDMDAAELVGLPDWYNQLWDTLAALRDLVRERRLAAGLTQAQLARRMGSAQAVIARVESDATGVGFDIVLKALFALGVPRAEIGEVLAGDEDDWVPAVPRKDYPKELARPQRRSPVNLKVGPAKRPNAKVGV